MEIMLWVKRAVSLTTVAVFFVLLFRAAWVDFKTMRIPDRMNLAVFVTGAVSILTVPGPGLRDRLLGMVAVSLPMLAVAFIVPGGFGGGDIKLMAGSGLFLGWEGNVLAALAGIFAGGVCGLILLLTGKAGRKDAFPFGPCLCGGIVTAFVLLCRDGSYIIV